MDGPPVRCFGAIELLLETTDENRMEKRRSKRRRWPSKTCRVPRESEGRGGGGVESAPKFLNANHPTLKHRRPEPGITLAKGRLHILLLGRAWAPRLKLPYTGVEIQHTGSAHSRPNNSIVPFGSIERATDETDDKHEKVK